MTLNAYTLALQSLRHKPLATALNILLMAIGIAMMTFVSVSYTHLTLPTKA